jgi:hypothetical protein
MLTTIGEDRDKFEVGREYWSFYMETTNSGNALRNIVKVFKTRLLEKRYSQNCSHFYLEFEKPTNVNLGSTMSHNLGIYMNGYGSAQCRFYDTEEEAIIGFDNRIKELASYTNAHNRDIMYRKMYIPMEAKKSSLELAATSWKAGLSAKELKYLDWIINNLK